MYQVPRITRVIEVSSMKIAPWLATNEASSKITRATILGLVREKASNFTNSLSYDVLSFTLNSYTTGPRYLFVTTQR